MPVLDLPFAMKSTDVFGLNDQEFTLVPSGKAYVVVEVAASGTGLDFQPVMEPQIYAEPTPIQLAGNGDQAHIRLNFYGGTGTLSADIAGS